MSDTPLERPATARPREDPDALAVPLPPARAELEGIGRQFLALWELAHGLEWVAMTGLVATLVVPPVGSAWLSGLLFVVVSVLVVLALSALAAATARVTIERAARFYWRAALVVVVVGASASWLLGIQR